VQEVDGGGGPAGGAAACADTPTRETPAPLRYAQTHGDEMALGSCRGDLVIDPKRDAGCLQCGYGPRPEERDAMVAKLMDRRAGGAPARAA
jgi:hypothetical protein